MRDAQSAKPQAFKTWDGWLAFNLAVNLTQMQERRRRHERRHDQAAPRVTVGPGPTARRRHGQERRNGNGEGDHSSRRPPGSAV